MPAFPENYIHRIGRTGRAEKEGKSILFYTEKEEEQKIAIEVLMDKELPRLPFPEEVIVEQKLIAEERDQKRIKQSLNRTDLVEPGEAFHEKSALNQKVNLGGSYRREIKYKFKKPKTRGDKGQNLRKKKKK